MSDRTSSFTAQQAQRRDDLQTVVASIDHQRDKYIGLLPGDIDFDDFRNAFITAVQIRPSLLDADRQSLWLALQRAASDGLKPDNREGALVIFGDDQEDEDGNRVPSQAKGKKKVVWMPMIAGLIKLVRNTGTVAGIRAKLVYRGERVILSDIDGKESYSHERVLADGEMIDDSPQNIIGAYAVVNYKDGTWEMEPMSRAQIDRVRAVSRAKNGPWAPWYDEMAKKTVLRRLIKRLERARELKRLDDTLDRDTTLEIDGVATDNELARSIAQEFTGQAQQQSREAVAATRPDESKPVETKRGPGRPPASKKAEADALAEERRRQYPHPDDAPKTTQAPAATREKPPEQKAPEPEKTPAPPPPDSDIEIWAVDELGEPIENPEPLTALGFSEWLAAHLPRSANPDAILEHNADNIADARAHPAAAKVIDAALAARQEAPPFEQKTSTKKPRTFEPIIALTPKGTLHDPNFRAKAKEQVATLADEDEIQAWIAANEPTYKNRAVEIVIPNWLNARRKELGLPIPAAEPPEETLLDRVRRELMEGKFKTVAELTAWSQGPIRPLIMACKTSDPTMFKEISDAVDTLNTALEPPA